MRTEETFEYFCRNRLLYDHSVKVKQEVMDLKLCCHSILLGENKKNA